MSVPRRCKDPDEKIVLTWDFSSDLDAGETLTGTPTIELWVSTGNEQEATLVLDGDPRLDNTSTMVQQVVHAGTLGITYGIKAVASTTNPDKILAFTGELLISLG
jgi:hypothetical protein